MVCKSTMKETCKSGKPMKAAKKATCGSMKKKTAKKSTK